MLPRESCLLYTSTDYNDFKQLQKRLRGGDESIIKRITLLFNPILQDHWIYEEFFLGKWDESKNYYGDDKQLILKTTYKDNRWLTPDDIAKLENETDRYYYEVYTLGNWGVLGNLIFTNWETKMCIRDRMYIDRDGLWYDNECDEFSTGTPEAWLPLPEWEG